MRKISCVSIILTILLVANLGFAEDTASESSAAKPWFGIDLKNSVEKKIEEVANGVLIKSVVPGSNAEKIGLTKDDLVKKVNSAQVNSIAEFEEQIAKQQPNDEVVVTVLRNKEELELKFLLEDLHQRAKNTMEKLGFSVKTFKENEIEGVVVAQVASGSYADYSKLNVNDFILSVDHHDFNGLAEFHNIISNVNLTRQVKFMIVRYQDNKQVLLPLSIGPEVEEGEEAEAEAAETMPEYDH